MGTGEYWDDEDDWEEESAGSNSVGGRGAGWMSSDGSGGGAQASLALGFVAMAPLLLAYEYGLATEPELTRSLSERALFRLYGLVPGWEIALRRGTLALGVLVALGLCFKRQVVLVPSLLRIFLQGVVGAILFGPVLALCMGLLGGFEVAVASQATSPSLATAGRLLGGAAFEELLFRVGLYGVLFVTVRRVVSFFGAGAGAARWSAELLAVLGSALGFAAFHLAAFSDHLGPGGYDWDGALFTWRALAGVLLALIFRLRGPGVAAWSHGLFNLAVLLGAGPEVFL